MKNWKGLAIVGALALGAVVSSLPVTVEGGPIPLPPYGQLKAACEEAPISLDECLVTVRGFHAALTGALEDNSTVIFFDNVVSEMKKVLGLRGKMSCSTCLNTVNDFQNTLAQNATIESIEAFGALACEQAYADPAVANQCAGIVSPVLAHTVLEIENLSPGAVCEAVELCP